MKRDAAGLAGEIADIRHAYNNIFNVLSGYAELAREADRLEKGGDYRSFVDRLLRSMPGKTTAVRKLSERLTRVQNAILKNKPR
jgi:hypothetical protein